MKNYFYYLILKSKIGTRYFKIALCLNEWKKLLWKKGEWRTPKQLYHHSLAPSSVTISWKLYHKVPLSISFPISISRISPNIIWIVHEWACEQVCEAMSISRGGSRGSFYLSLLGNVHSSTTITIDHCSWLPGQDNIYAKMVSYREKYPYNSFSCYIKR